MSQSQSQYICRICYIPGHWEQQCPIKYICHKCPRSDHWIQNCPKNNYHQNNINVSINLNPNLNTFINNNCNLSLDLHNNFIPANTDQDNDTFPFIHKCGHQTQQKHSNVVDNIVTEFDDLATNAIPKKVKSITTTKILTGTNMMCDLINGYVRRIDNLFQQNKSCFNNIVPPCINQIIAMFYLWSTGNYLSSIKDGRWHRIYYSSNTKDVTLQIPEIGKQLYKMSAITNNEPYVSFTDIFIQWSVVNLHEIRNGLKLVFQDKIRTMTSTVESAYGSLHIFEDRGAVTNKMSTEIVNHIINDIDPHDSWNSYCFSKMVLHSLPKLNWMDDDSGFTSIWGDQFNKLITDPRLQNVHKIQLLNYSDPNNITGRNAKGIFYIVRGCVMEQDNPLLQDTKFQETIGIDICDSFYDDFESVASQPPNSLDNGDRFCIATCFNLFADANLTTHYLYGVVDDQIKHSDYLFCRQYDEWVDNNLMDLLEVDFRISRLRERQYCMEQFALKFCRAMKEVQKDGTTKMFEIFERMKELKLLNELMNKIIVSKDLKTCVLYLLGDKESNFVSNWTIFKDLVDEKYVTAIMDNVSEISKIEMLVQLHH